MGSKEPQYRSDVGKLDPRQSSAFSIAVGKTGSQGEGLDHP